MYEKQIIYLDYLENGVKVKNIGHVKVLFRDNDWNMDLHIRGLYRTDTMLTELYGVTRKGEITLARLCIHEGSCYFNGVFAADNVQQSGVAAAELCGIRIRLSDTRQIEAMWRECAPPRSAIPCEAGREMPSKMQTEPVPPPLMQEDTPSVTASSVNTAEPCGWEPPSEADVSFREEGGALPKDSHKPEKVYEDKWTQLCHTYEVVHPFGREEYIRLNPGDFVILREEYQELVNNSFLLHGYYNYRHLILGRNGVGEQNGYYLGVPGTYHEREKMVAVMFGFEGFESREEKITQGTFGYYMKRVQI